MELNVKEMEKEYVALGGKINGKTYTAPIFETVLTRRLQSDITNILLDYKHKMDKNVIRAQIPSYKKHALEVRDALVKEKEERIEFELSKKPEYVRSRALHTMLEAVRDAKNIGIDIGDTFDKKRLEAIFTGLGGQILSKTGKKRTKLIIYELPKVDSPEITKLNELIAAESGEYMHVDHTVLGKIPTIKRKRENKHLKAIESAEKKIRAEQMADPRYAAASATLDVINAFADMEKTTTKEMAD